jgi:hypothetical protein
VDNHSRQPRRCAGLCNGLDGGIILCTSRIRFIQRCYAVRCAPRFAFGTRVTEDHGRNSPNRGPGVLGFAGAHSNLHALSRQIGRVPIHMATFIQGVQQLQVGRIN